MKKLIFGLLVALSGLTATAQVHRAQSFFGADVQTLIVTNTLGITNIQSTAYTLVTNIHGLSYTNLSGALTIVGKNQESQNLLGDVSLWTDRNSTFAYPVYALTAGTNATVQSGPFIGSIYIRQTGGSGANTATTYVFAPVPNSDSNKESTASGDLITITVTPAGATQVTSITPISVMDVIGCEKLRLVKVYAGDTDASSEINVLECTFNGFVP